MKFRECLTYVTSFTSMFREFITSEKNALQKKNSIERKIIQSMLQWNSISMNSDVSEAFRKLGKTKMNQ